MLKTFREHGRAEGECERLLRVSRSLLLTGVYMGGVALASSSAGQASVISSKAIGAKPSPELPKYVSTLNDWSDRYDLLGVTEGNDWLLLGLQHRSRIENFDNFYRISSLPSDGGYFSRHWFYLGVRDVLDPFRFTLELEDSRREGFDFPPECASGQSHRFSPSLC
ncbi:hypothetical protein N9A90_02310 [Akkermansiaceae bacterium]|nr:hypothetical protein [Akkermansiaceae bacterium]MDA7883662.1 hypothetical protein [Akkermansiaceae bacterium]